MTPNNRYSEYTPDWTETVLDDISDPPKEQLAKFDYLKEDFYQAFEIAYKQNTLAHIVFSHSEHLLKADQGILVNVQEALDLPEILDCQSDFVPVSIRSREIIPQLVIPRGHQIMGLAQKISHFFLIEAIAYAQGNSTRLEIDLIQNKSSKPVRPFGTSVKDENQQIIVDSFQVNSIDQTESFPGPPVESYYVALIWANHQGALTIQFERFLYYDFQRRT